MDDEKRITRAVGWLNNNIDLAAKISCMDVMEFLGKIDTSTSLRILKDLEISSETVENPTAYIIAAARRAAEKTGSADSADPTGKIARQVRWLNDNVSLQKPLFYSAVVGVLSKVEVSEAMSILKDLEAQADNVKNPIAYVTAAAERLSSRRGKRPAREPKVWREVGAENAEKVEASDADENEESGEEETGSKKEKQELTDEKKIAKQESGEEETGSKKEKEELTDEKKIAKQVGWLNARGKLAENISYSDVKDALEACPIGSAMRILKDLHVNADGVSNPTKYLQAAAQRASGVNPTKNPTKPSDSEESKKIARHVGWLNASGYLQDRLSYSDIKEPLEMCDLKEVQKILGDLENGADTIENPTGYVRAAAFRRSAQKNGSSRGGAREPQMSSEDAKKVSRQVGWLNANIDLALAISYSDVKEFLESLDKPAAMRILKDVEYNAERITNPTAYIISAAKRKFTSS